MLNPKHLRRVARFFTSVLTNTQKKKYWLVTTERGGVISITQYELASNVESPEWQEAVQSINS